MSAPMVPNHHTRGNVCETRPAYREGRLPKAVKVYTVNQESRYLLIQGVPAVGGCQELVKLCAVYGTIEEYRILDDYPAEEFTEVYLFKFKKIQSARFAKKKLDDYSFFGGVLHVCYAPEYESVEETREKLQDRRKIIAAKLRQYASTTETASHASKEVQYQYDESEQPNKSQASQLQNVSKSDQIPTNQSFTNVNQETEHIQPFNSQPELNQTSPQGGDNSVPFINLELPPPPLNMAVPRHRHPPVHPDQYEYAWVPSSHSTLPPNFDGRRETESLQADSDKMASGNQDKEETKNSKDSSQKKLKPNEKLVNGMVVRDYKKPGKVPKFIPRQALKKSSDNDVKVSKPKSESDSVNKELRVNAFTLGDSQGPTMPGKDEQTLKILPTTQKSVDQSVREIRKRISKFITEKVPQQKKSKPS